MSDFQQFSEALKQDPDMRAKFFAEIRTLLLKYGLDPAHAVALFGNDQALPSGRCRVVSPVILVCDEE